MNDDPGFDLLDPDFYIDPYPAYAWLRENQPIYWDSTNEIWGVFGYDDIVDIELRREEFSNASDQGGYRPKIPADPSIIGLDDPHHATRRALVARRFTPRAVGLLTDMVRQATRRLLDDAIGHGGEIEVVTELAAPLPAMVIGQLLGFDDSMWPSLLEWANRTVALGGGPRAYNDDGIAAYFEFRQACTDLYEQRRAGPVTDDLVSLWVRAEDEGLRDGERFGLEEIIADCLLLLDGGAETTRTVIGRGIMELAARPDQWAMLKQGAGIESAVEELIRWVTPVHNMCRMSTVDAVVGTTTIPKGQQVMLQYGSANRDPAHFENPEVFDIARADNHHIAFGQGTHFCLGAALARQELQIFFAELLNRVESIQVTQPLVEHATAFVHGIASGHISVRPVSVPTRA